MARPLRIEEANMWYHVIDRGNARNRIFINPIDCQKLLKQLAERCEKYDVEIHSYVLLSNHFHFFLKTNKPNLSRFMHSLLTGYTTWYNLKHKRVGHLFQGRYKSIVVDKTAYANEISRYIHLNPARTRNITKLSLSKKINFLKKYKWSSFPAFLGLVEADDFLHTNIVLEQFGDNIDEQRLNYSNFIKKGLTDKIENPFKHVIAQSILGDKTFVNNVRKKVLINKLKDKETKNNAKMINSIELGKIIDVVSSYFKIEKEKIINQPIRHTGCEARQILLFLAVEYCIGKISKRKIGVKLGDISGAAVDMAHKRIINRKTKDKKLSEKLNDINKLLFLNN